MALFQVVTLSPLASTFNPLFSHWAKRLAVMKFGSLGRCDRDVNPQPVTNSGQLAIWLTCFSADYKLSTVRPLSISQ